MTSHEKDLIDNMEANGFTETALRLRKFIATQNRDTNADCGNITPNQARYAFDNALEAPPDANACDSTRFDRDFSILRSDQAKMEADNAALEAARAKTDATLAEITERHRIAASAGVYGLGALIACPAKPKSQHKFIHLDGTPRADPACL